MKIIIKAKNLERSESLDAFIEKKFSALKKFIDILKREDEIGKTLAEVIVEVEKESNHHRKGDIFSVKAQILLPGRNVIAQAQGDDLLLAVVETREELKMEIEKYKMKNIDKVRREQKKFKNEIEI